MSPYLQKTKITFWIQKKDTSHGFFTCSVLESIKYLLFHFTVFDELLLVDFLTALVIIKVRAGGPFLVETQRFLRQKLTFKVLWVRSLHRYSTTNGFFGEIVGGSTRLAQTLRIYLVHLFAIPQILWVLCLLHLKLLLLIHKVISLVKRVLWLQNGLLDIGVVLLLSLSIKHLFYHIRMGTEFLLSECCDGRFAANLWERGIFHVVSGVSTDGRTVGLRDQYLVIGVRSPPFAIIMSQITLL